MWVSVKSGVWSKWISRNNKIIKMYGCSGMWTFTYTKPSNYLFRFNAPSARKQHACQQNKTPEWEHNVHRSGDWASPTGPGTRVSYFVPIREIKAKHSPVIGSRCSQLTYWFHSRANKTHQRNSIYLKMDFSGRQNGRVNMWRWLECARTLSWPMWLTRHVWGAETSIHLKHETI